MSKTGCLVRCTTNITIPQIHFIVKPLFLEFRHTDERISPLLEKERVRVRIGFTDCTPHPPLLPFREKRLQSVSKLQPIFYPTAPLILNMGKNMATTIVPITAPIKTITSGSIMLVKPSTAVSTSAS